MNNFNEIRSFTAEHAADILLHKLLTPEFVSYLSTFYALRKDGGGGNPKNVEDDFKKTIACWLNLPYTEGNEDWFATYLLRFRLFRWYQDELRFINEGPFNDLTDMEAFCSAYSADCTDWIDIVDGGETVGFLVMGYGANCHPEAKFYIEEAFVMPGYRHRCLMGNTLRKYMQTHEGTYCYYVLKKNKNALNFWKHLFEKEDYKPCLLFDMGDVNLLQFGWKK